MSIRVNKKELIKGYQNFINLVHKHNVKLEYHLEKKM